MTHSELEARQEELSRLMQENDRKRIQIRRQKGDTTRLLALLESDDARLFDEWLKLKAEPIEEFTDAGKQMFPAEEREERF